MAPCCTFDIGLILLVMPLMKFIKSKVRLTNNRRYSHDWNVSLATTAHEVPGVFRHSCLVSPKGSSVLECSNHVPGDETNSVFLEILCGPNIRVFQSVKMSLTVHCFVS